MPIPAGIENLSTTPASNNPAGSEGVSEGDDHIRNAYAFIRQSFTAGADIASAGTITPPSTGGSFNLTGTTTVTSIATTNSWSGRKIRFRHTGAHTFTQASTLVCPNGVSITFAVGDISEWAQNPSGGWEICGYLPVVYSTAPSFVPSGTVVPTNGVYLPAANTVGIATASTSRVQVDGSGNIAHATSLAATLSNTITNTSAAAAAAAQVSVATNNGAIIHNIGSTAAGGTGSSTYSGTNVWNLYTTSNTELHLGANNTANRLVIGTTGDLIGRGVAVPRYKSANTDRASNIVASNDPDLVYAIPGAGTYAINLSLLFQGVTAGTGGLAFGVNYSGTFTAVSSQQWGAGIVNLAAGTLNATAVQNAVTLTVFTSGTLSTVQRDWFNLTVVLTATGAGTFAFNWAQQSSNVNATRMLAGSNMTVTQLS